jgi:hypothetical protein
VANRAQRRGLRHALCVLCGELMGDDRNAEVGATWVAHGTCWRDYAAVAEGRPDLMKLDPDAKRAALRAGLARVSRRLYARHAERRLARGDGPPMNGARS